MRVRLSPRVQLPGRPDVSTHVDAIRLHRTLGRAFWNRPEPFGPDGWQVGHRTEDASVIVTASDGHDGDPRIWWLHASIARAETMPTYDDLVMLHSAVWGSTGEAYQVFAPAADHVNIHAHALHLWGRLDGKRVLPSFGLLGSI
jgi:hypothetical protein